MTTDWADYFWTALDLSTLDITEPSPDDGRLMAEVKASIRRPVLEFYGIPNDLEETWNP